MTIVRAKHDARYFTVANQPFEDKRLSWEARGLYGYLLSKPDCWEVRMADLLKQGPAGEYKIAHMLAELEEAGYMTKSRIRLADGTFTWNTTIFEIPELAAMPRKSPDGDNHTAIFQSVENPPSGKPRHVSSTDSASTEETKTEQLPLAAHAAKAAAAEYFPANLQAYQDEIGPLDAGGMQKLLRLENAYSPEAVREAIVDAAQHRPLKNPPAYLDAILKRWKQDGRPPFPTESKGAALARQWLENQGIAAGPENEPLPDQEATRIWQAVKETLRPDFPKGVFHSWVDSTEPISYAGGLLTIGTANECARDWLEKNLSRTVPQILAEIVQGQSTIEFVIR